MPEKRTAPPCVLVVFGASGDLTSRKLMPAVAQLARRGQLPEEFTVVGVARTEMDDEDFRRHIGEAVEEQDEAWRSVLSRFRYVAGDYGDEETFHRLERTLKAIDRDLGTNGSRVYYLATPPGVFDDVAHGLAQRGLNAQENGAFSRLVIEKPFGHDLATAEELDRGLHACFAENQIYRIDHYLGKETVQNVLALRFANVIFEPIWNRRYIDHVQITVAEEAGIGHRGSFYETAGALRDIVQNHLMQVLALVAMEPPARMEAEAIRDEKVKVLNAVDVLTTDEVETEVVRGQYDGYLEEEGVDPESRVETFVAMRLKVDNWRWAGVPFYVRTGKRLAKRVTEVMMQFKPVPHLPFSNHLTRELTPNDLVVRIQPDEGIALQFGAKVPGPEFRIRDAELDFTYAEEFDEEPPEAYERLLLDAMIGDPTLFIRSDEVRQAWRIVEPLLAEWGNGGTALHTYEGGSWGPDASDQLLATDGHRWRNP